MEETPEDALEITEKILNSSIIMLLAEIFRKILSGTTTE